jgi:hypothetical protein
MIISENEAINKRNMPNMGRLSHVCSRDHKPIIMSGYL